MPTLAEIRAVPKVLLHDHLDGGLRPATIVELAAETGYHGLPATDAGELASGWPRAPAAARWSCTWRPSSTPSA